MGFDIATLGGSMKLVVHIDSLQSAKAALILMPLPIAWRVVFDCLAEGIILPFMRRHRGINYPCLHIFEPSNGVGSRVHYRREKIELTDTSQMRTVLWERKITYSEYTCQEDRTR